MKVAILQKHSKNNEDIYQMSLMNHVKYAAEHEYSMVQENISYEKDIKEVLDFVSVYLKIYDMIFCVGSDVVFTNMSIPIGSFLNNGAGVAISLEDLGSPCNADTTVWKNCEECHKVIEYLNNNKESWVNDSWGIQKAFNQIFKNRPKEIEGFINFHPVRKMQSTIFSDYPSKWQPGDYSLHFVGCNNDEKRQRMGKFLKEGKVWWRPGIL